MDLLARGRDLGVERTHETYTAATTKVMPNMNMQMAATISPVRMFFLARRRVIMTRGSLQLPRDDHSARPLRAPQDHWRRGEP